jgi:hypothetical protein
MGLENVPCCSQIEHMSVSYTLRLDDDLFERVQTESRKRHKATVADMFRDVIVAGLNTLPPIEADDNLAPLPDGIAAKALAQMTREELAEDARLGRASSRP